MTIVLSPQAIIKFANLVKAEVQARALEQARQIPSAMADATAELEIQSNPLLSSEE